MGGVSVGSARYTAAGVVLAGGRSQRMGTAKGGLDWHGSTLLHRTAAVLARSVGGPVVVVTAPGQRIDDLPDGVAVVPDPVPGQGPLRGLATGLAAVADRAPVAFVCATDLPFLHPAFVRRVLATLAASDAEVALPVLHGFRQPLAAAYRTALAGRLDALLGAGERRLGRLAELCTVAAIDAATLLADPALARLDPRLDSVLNINTPEEYAAARRRPPPAVHVRSGDTGERAVRAGTLGAAAAAVGVVPQRCGSAWLNGDPVPVDIRLPLVTGDRLAFRP